MNGRFLNRADAGRILAAKLMRYANHPDVLVMALPRGGVPVGYEVARALNAPLDIMLVRKLGVPGHDELAMGAIASGGIRILNRNVIESLQIPPDAIEMVEKRESLELMRRETNYRGNRPRPISRVSPSFLSMTASPQDPPCVSPSRPSVNKRSATSW